MINSILTKYGIEFSSNSESYLHNTKVFRSRYNKGSVCNDFRVNMNSNVESTLTRTFDNYISNYANITYRINSSSDSCIIDSLYNYEFIIVSPNIIKHPYRYENVIINTNIGLNTILVGNKGDIKYSIQSKIYENDNFIEYETKLFCMNNFKKYLVLSDDEYVKYNRDENIDKIIN